GYSTAEGNDRTRPAHLDRGAVRPAAGGRAIVPPRNADDDATGGGEAGAPAPNPEPSTQFAVP
ncbi:MAG: hypothetical protein ACRD2O_13035, partial [Terriglobia bacterium]